MNLNALAIQKALNNQWADAIELNHQILLETPNDIHALNRLSQAYIQIKDFSNAKKTCLTVLELDKYNPIAQKNLDKIKTLEKNNCHQIHTNSQNIKFIEEPGKSSVIPLVRICEKSILTILQPCLELELKIRQQSISFYLDQKYIGRFPDDIAKRLIWLSKRDNKYSAYIKSVDSSQNRITVFIKEIKQSTRNKNYPSFPTHPLSVSAPQN